MEGLAEKYLADVRVLFPLHRVLIAGYAFLVSVLATTSSSLESCFARVMSVRLSTLTFEDHGSLHAASIGHFALGMSSVLVSYAVYAVAARVFIKRIGISIKLQERLDTASTGYAKVGAVLGDAAVSAAIDHASSILDRERKYVSRLNALSELFVGFSISTFFGFFWGNGLDLLVSLVFAFLASGFLAVSVYWFLRYLLPYELHIESLSGRVYDGKFPVT